MSTSSPVNLSQLDIEIQPCPLCGEINFTSLAHHDRNLLGIKTVGCNKCGLVQTNPRPSKNGLDRFYREHYRVFYQGTIAPDQDYIFSLKKDRRLAYTVSFFIERIGLPKNAKILDFGCGEGSLFLALREAGFNGAFYGVEPNSSFGEYASRYGNATVSNAIRSREPVDLAVINHVLEHLHDPIGTLKDIRCLIKPEGHLYIDVPDVEEYSNIYDLHIAHIFHFTERTLWKLVEQAGFTVKQIEKHQPPHHPHSIRLIAIPTAKNAPEISTTADGEIKAWTAVRSAGRYVNTLRLRLRRITWLHKIYKGLKRMYS